MTEKARRAAVLRLRKFLDSGVPRKMALFNVRQELRKAKLPHSQASIYVWARQFGISTK